MASPKMTGSTKVFCVGMNKTGTSSIASCLELLELGPVCSPPELGAATRRLVRKILDHQDYGPLVEVARRYRSFEDRPWNVWRAYEAMDRAFPDSVFILSVRDPKSWWRSVARWITVVKPQLLNLYARHLQADSLSEAAFVAGYERHNEAIRSHFRGSNRLLEIDVVGGEGWAELCGFLGRPVPDAPFPHANRQRY